MKTRHWRLLMAFTGAGCFGFCYAYLRYPWHLALLTAFAIVALAYSGRRTYYEQRRLYRALSPPDSSSEDAP